MKTRRNSEKSATTKIWSRIEKELRNLKYKKINLVTLRQMNHISDPSNCTYQNCSEEIKSLG